MVGRDSRLSLRGTKRADIANVSKDFDISEAASLWRSLHREAQMGAVSQELVSGYGRL